MNGIVLGGTGGVWRVRRDDGEIIETSLRGRVKKSNAGRRADGSLRRDTIAAAEDTLKLAITTVLEGVTQAKAIATPQPAATSSAVNGAAAPRA